MDENIFQDIPKNYEEFIIFNNIEEWPFRLTSEKIIPLREELIDFQDFDFIKDCLENEISIDFSSLSFLDGKREEHEKYLMTYADQLLNVENILHPKPNKKQEDKRIFFEKLGEKVRATSDEVASIRKYQDADPNTIQELNLKSVELFQYSGFNDDEFNDLPGASDAMRLINLIVKNTKIAKKYRHTFKKIFFSEATLGMVHDLFWWIFLDYFKNETDSENKEKLFTRLSMNYGLLLLSIPDLVKDGFLQIFPEQMAMTLYSAFYHSFPDSRRLFGPDFKQNVINTCHLWMTGMHPLPNSFNFWPIDKIISDKESSTDEVADSKSNLPKIQSHQIGPAFKYSKTLFDSKGCCPLIHKFLQLQDIEPIRTDGSKCGHRLEVTNICQTETYHSQVKKLLTKLDESKHTHIEATDEHDKEILEIAKRRQELERRFEKLQCELNASNSVLDMRHSLDQFAKE